jgi:hypothetical protein
MRRWILALLVVLSALAIAAPAEAGWGHRHGWGHHHGGWGHRHWGWRGGWGYGYRSYGWGGWGGWYGPGISIGYCQPRYTYYNYCAPSLCWPNWGCGYNSGCGTSVGYYAYQPGGVYYNPSANFAVYNLPATYQPAELAYGPLAAKQFIGLDRNFALGPLREPPVRLPLLGRVVLDRGELKAARPVVRVSSIEARRKAEKYLAEGDALFLAQRFHSALQKYKAASNAAPDVAESYWRQGHAMIATSNFSLAAGAFKRAIALSDDTTRGGFKLDDLYGSAAMAKTVHLEQLAAHALAHGESPDSYFLIGVTLAYDRQHERAGAFFDRAAELAGISGGHIAAFRDGMDGPIAVDAGFPVIPAAAPVPESPLRLEVPSVPVAAVNVGVEI